jgi:hypothetical protein
LDEFWLLTGDRDELLSSEFPSWVLDPRFIITGKEASIGSALSGDDQRRFFAAGRDRSKSRAKIEFIEDGNTLSVNGLLVDEIRSVGNSPPSTESRMFSKDNDLVETVTSWHDIATLKQEDTPYYFASCNKSEAFWRVILRDRTIVNYHHSHRTQARMPKVLTRDFRIPLSSQAEIDELLLALTKGGLFPFRRRFFVTSKGLMGLRPHNAVVGDFVYVLFTADVPYILRKLKRDGDFRVIGDW